MKTFPKRSISKNNKYICEINHEYFCIAHLSIIYKNIKKNHLMLTNAPTMECFLRVTVIAESTQTVIYKKANMKLKPLSCRIEH